MLQLLVVTAARDSADQTVPTLVIAVITLLATLGVMFVLSRF